MCLGPHQNQGWGWRHETGLSPPVKYFTDRSKAVFLLWVFYVFSVLCLLCLCECLFTCALWSPAGKGLTSWLSFVVSNCKFVTFPLVSWVRCGTWLFRFLIFAPLLTLTLKIFSMTRVDTLTSLLTATDTTKTDLQIGVHIWKLFFLFLNQNICCTQKNHLSDTLFWAPKTHIKK